MNLSSIIEYLVYFFLTAPLCFYIFNRNPYYALYFFIIWLPFQTFVLSLMSVSGFLSNQLILFVTSLKELVLLVLLITLFYKRLIFKGKKSFVDYLFLINLSVILFYFVIPDSVLKTQSTLQEKILGFRASIIPLAIFIAGRSIPFNPAYFRKAIRLIILVCLIIIIFGFFEFIFIPRDTLIGTYMHYLAIKNGSPEMATADPGEMRYVVQFGGFEIKRMVSIFLSPLSLAYFLILPFSLFLSSYLGRREKSQLKIKNSFFLFLSISAGILFSNTRGVIAICILMFFAIYFKRNGYKAVIVGAIFFLIASATFMNSIVKDTVNLDDPSTAAHALAYTVGIESILQHPLGLGLGKAGPVANQLGAANMYALGSSNANGDTEAGVGESLYLTLTMEKGIPALIFFLSFIGGLIYQAKRVRVLAKNEQKLLGYTIYFSTIIFLIASIPTEHWFGFQSSCIYWWFSGIMCQIYSNSFLNIKEVLPA